MRSLEREATQKPPRGRQSRPVGELATLSQAAKLTRDAGTLGRVNAAMHGTDATLNLGTNLKRCSNHASEHY